MFNLFWFRRDLRLDDNVGLWECLKTQTPSLLLFIFDTNILGELEINDKRVSLIFDRVLFLKTELEKRNSSLMVFYGDPVKIHQSILEILPIQCLYFNHDYEPYPLERDDKVKNLYKSYKRKVFTFKDHVIFEKEEILNPQQEPYKVYSQYKKQWFKKFELQQLKIYPSQELLNFAISKEMIKQNKDLFKKLFQQQNQIYEDLNIIDEGRFPNPVLEKMHFQKVSYVLPNPNLDEVLLKNYAKNRDFPFLESGTSKISVHLRFGLRSIREIIKTTFNLSIKYIEELVWREFYIMILYFFPESVNKEWNPKYQYLRDIWRNPELDEKAEEDFLRWCSGETGYPLVDAGMKELNETGYQHNRVRMVCANFLVKDLLIDWKFGERYYAKKLMDFELASNVGNWQWCSGTGVDAAPYFRIFNPLLQQKKFDPNYQYIKKWIPDFDENNYLKPIVDHEVSKEQVLKLFKKVEQYAQH
ncbi:MAG: DNA photolyase family protein [Leptospiraceae bacterium]|nr:DNA photolyase family protein [Leptospiraceae bacterium]MDW7975701.1 deoxyribodipyrimidine photo-lyase [Leptospiraceae bacterium]